MPHLRFFGSATIEDASGTTIALSSRRHPLVLLALLACAPNRSMGRGKLVGLLWPESGEQTARNRLNTCVHQVRTTLGNGVLQSSGDELRLSLAETTCDVYAFVEAVAAGDHARAIEHYGGPFLDGFRLDGSPELRDRVEIERERLADTYSTSLETMAEAFLQAGKPDQAVQWWRRRAGEDRYDSRVARRLMEALDASGNRAEALRVAQGHAQLLEAEFGTRPDPQVQAFATQLVQAGASAPAGSDPATSDPTTMPARRKEDRFARPADLAASAIAVLPFENLSGTADADPFAAGLHDDLLTELSRIRGLTVIARTSVLCYRDSRRPAQEIARELGVGTLVEGAVQSSGDRLRVNVQLIDARSGSHLWAERYDRALNTDSLFDIQSDLVERIVRSLRVELAPAGPANAPEATGRPTADLEAYRLHAQGNQQLVQLTDPSLRQAVAYFRGAIERDPGYALARVGLADALTALIDYGFEESDQAMAEAEASVRHALEAKPDLAEAHAVLGKLYNVQRKGPASIAELTRAVELMPGYGKAHDWLSWTWQCLGRPGPALDSARRAVEFDPLLQEAVSNLAVSHLASGQAGQALVESRRVREIAPGWTSGAFYEGLALYRLGRFDEAQSVLQGLIVEWVGAGPQAALALACVGNGDATRARKLQAELEKADEWFSVGLIHAALGDQDAAFAAFEQVADWGAYWPTLAVHHYFPDLMAALAGEARFRGMRANIHRAWGLAADGSFPA